MGVFEGRVVAVTGAARGIGAAVAREFARRGCHVAVSDIDEQEVRETASELERLGVETIADRVDVSDREAVYQWADRVDSEFDDVHYVVNNAGVSVTAPVDSLPYEDFEWLMETNFWGVVYGTKAFLPLIRSAGAGRIVNISSVFGIIATPTQSAYNASKFAVRGFTESLRAELELEEAPIGASCVHPGGVRTDIVRDSRIVDTGPFDRTPGDVVEEFERDLARTSPEEAAEQIADGVAAGEGRILVGTDATILDVVQRFFPSTYPGPVARVITRRW